MLYVPLFSSMQVQTTSCAPLMSLNTDNTRNYHSYNSPSSVPQVNRVLVFKLTYLQ